MLNNLIYNAITVGVCVCVCMCIWFIMDYFKMNIICNFLTLFSLCLCFFTDDAKM